MKNILFALIVIVSVSGCTKDEMFIPKNNLFLVGQTYLTGTNTDDFGFRFTSEYTATKLIVGDNKELTPIAELRISGAYPHLFIDGQKTNFAENNNSFTIGSFTMVKQ